MAEHVLQLRQIEKHYDGRVVVHPTDLVLEAGQTYALIGPSGCGKSTLLRLMIGLIEPDGGSVLFQGQPISGPNVLELRRKMGYVIQSGGLFPHLTARQNVALMADFLGHERNKTAARIAELAELTDLPVDWLNRYPAQLSGGQRQRVSLMRALVLDPDVLLLDEPLGALDPMIRTDLQTDLREIFAQLKKTVVLVTHDMAEAAYFAHSVILLRDGQIVQRGSTRELIDSPADPFVTQFVNAQRTGWEAV